MWILTQLAQCNSMLVYVSATLAQYNARTCTYICISVTLAQLLRNSVAKMCPGGDYGPGLLPGLRGSYLMEKHNHKRFQSLPAGNDCLYAAAAT